MLDGVGDEYASAIELAAFRQLELYPPAGIQERRRPGSEQQREYEIVPPEVDR